MVFVGGYWLARGETREGSAQSIAKFLGLISGYESLGAWFLRARTSAESHVRVEVDSEWLAPRLRVNKSDVSGETIEDLGFSIALYNSTDDQWQAATSLRAHIGAFSPNVENFIVLSFGRKANNKIIRSDLEGVLVAIVSAFDPDHAVVTSHERMDRIGAKKPWETGLLTYERGGVTNKHDGEMVGKYEALLADK
jgi:hypothetical protein